MFFLTQFPNISKPTDFIIGVNLFFLNIDLSNLDFLNRAAISVGIKEKIGSHTLRKTFAYFTYNSGIDLSLIQKVLNHSAPSITLNYIGITQDQMDDVYLNLNL